MAKSLGLFLRSPDNAFQRRLAEVAEQAAKRLGYRLVVASVRFDADEQVAQIREAIKNAAARDLMAILVSGVRDLDLAPVAHEAAAAGLEFALLNDGSFIDEVRQQHPDRAVFAATCDHTQIGRIHAAQVHALIGERGRVLCVTGNLGNIDARLRLEGLKQDVNSGLDLVELNADWTSECARRVVETWAKGLGAEEALPSVCVAQNDEMALGVRQALRDVACARDWTLTIVPILGCDGSEVFGQRLVREGRLKATVIMPPTTGQAIDAIEHMRKSGELPPARVLLPVVSFPPLSRLKQ
jgi:ABC-type sugar transport system substrate-binding protein